MSNQHEESYKWISTEDLAENKETQVCMHWEGQFSEWIRNREHVVMWEFGVHIRVTEDI